MFVHIYIIDRLLHVVQCTRFVELIDVASPALAFLVSFSIHCGYDHFRRLNFSNLAASQIADYYYVQLPTADMCCKWMDSRRHTPLLSNEESPAETVD